MNIEVTAAGDDGGSPTTTATPTASNLSTYLSSEAANVFIIASLAITGCIGVTLNLIIFMFYRNKTTNIQHILYKYSAVLDIISSGKSQNHACAFSHLPCDLVLQFDFYGAHWKDKFNPNKMAHSR
eukprot:sb/3475606/